jgi:hypothetical protein
MSFLDKLFGKRVEVIDLEQAYEALHKEGKSSDPIGTVIWMDVDGDGNVVGTSKQLPPKNIKDVQAWMDNLMGISHQGDAQAAVPAYGIDAWLENYKATGSLDGGGDC